MSKTPITDREQDILACQIKAGVAEETMVEGGWRRLRVAEEERNYLVEKIERLENQCWRQCETIKFYQGPKEKYNIEAVQHYEKENTKLEAENAELLAMLKRAEIRLRGIIELTDSSGKPVDLLASVRHLIKKVEGGE